MIEQSHAVLDMRVTNLEKVVERVSQAVESIDDSLKVLTRLDVKHDESNKGLDRAFINIKDHETRIHGLELEMPTMKLVRGWVITGSIALVGLVGLTVIKMVLGLGWMIAGK